MGGKRISPKQLSKESARWFLKMQASLGELSNQQIELLAMMAEEQSNYWAAAEELGEYVSTHHRMTVPGTGGSLQPHPALRVQKQSVDSYIALDRQLRLSMKGNEEPATIDDSFEDADRAFEELISK